MMEMQQFKKHIFLAAKIAVGSSAAIYTAQKLNLEYATSAGTIALLTLMTTKWETLKLSSFRLITFVFTVISACLIFPYIKSVWLTYGIVIFVLTLFSDIMGWRATISVNSVITVHLVTSGDFSVASVRNEFILLIIGVTMAIILNLFNDNHNHKRSLVSYIRYTEDRLQKVMYELSNYLLGDESKEKFIKDIHSLEKDLKAFIKESYEFQSNTFHSHPGYYIDYFEMRRSQCYVLGNIYLKVEKLEYLPKQAEIIADYILYLASYIMETNTPDVQIEKLEEVFEKMKTEALPKTREEFESRALLYHILIDIEKFLNFKMNFVKNLSPRQRREYWR